MHLQILAIGTRMPRWVGQAVQEYDKRMPAQTRVQWRELKAESRTNTDVDTCRAREAKRLDAVIPGNAWRVILDETGTRLTSQAFAHRLAHWQQLGRPVAMIIGGPDGIDQTLTSSADETIRLSDLTLPHPLVRVVLAEQLYRAASILGGHPYHRN